MSRGTSGSIRWFLELLTTGYPVRAKSSSADPATEESRAEKTKSQSRLGSRPLTTRSAAAEGMASFKCHFTASSYFLPDERSEAATSVSSNQGWLARSWTRRWPTMPVAPRTPARNFCLNCGRSGWNGDELTLHLGNWNCDNRAEPIQQNHWKEHH